MTATLELLAIREIAHAFLVADRPVDVYQLALDRVTPILGAAFSLIMQQRSVSGSPTGSPVGIATMLDFAARHNIAPQTEHFPMSRVNDAFARLESGKARYRIVLDADF